MRERELVRRQARGDLVKCKGADVFFFIGVGERIIGSGINISLYICFLEL